MRDTGGGRALSADSYLLVPVLLLVLADLLSLLLFFLINLVVLYFLFLLRLWAGSMGAKARILVLNSLFKSSFEAYFPVPVSKCDVRMPILW